MIIVPLQIWQSLVTMKTPGKANILKGSFYSRWGINMNITIIDI